MDKFATGGSGYNATFTEVLQALSCGLLTEDEAKTVLRRIRPGWFPAEDGERVSPPWRVAAEQWRENYENAKRRLAETRVERDVLRREVGFQTSRAESAEAEGMRLRKALEQVVRPAGVGPGFSRDEMRGIARRALQGGQP